MHREFEHDRQRRDSRLPGASAWAINRYANLACAWAGPVFAVLFLIGFTLLAGFLPPPSPSDTAQETVAMYTESQTLFRVGLIVMLFGVALLGPFAMAIAAQTRRHEVGFPVLSWVQIACAAYTMTLTALLLTIFGVASFRAGETSAEITQALNDMGWFLILFPFQPGELWFVAIALAIFADQRPNAPYPRWLGWFNLWLASLTLPAGLIIFFKDGAFAWNGAIAFYLPLTAFFIFTVVMSVFTIKAINRTGVAQDDALVPA